MLPQSAPSLERQASFNTTHGAAEDKHAYCPVCHRRFINVRTRNSHIGIPKCINSARSQGLVVPPDPQSLRGHERHGHLKESWAQRYIDERDRSQTPAQGPVAARSSGGNSAPAPVAPTNGGFSLANFNGGTFSPAPITSMNGSVPPVGSQYNYYPSRPASQNGMSPHLPRPAYTPAQHWSMNAATSQSRPFSTPPSGLASTGSANGPHLSQAPVHAARPAPTALQRSATYTPPPLQFPTALQRSATYTPPPLQFPPANPQTTPAGPFQRTSWIHPQQTTGQPAQLQQSASFGGHGSVHPGQGARTAPGRAFSPPQPAQAGSFANAHAVRNSGAVSQTTGRPAQLQQSAPFGGHGFDVFDYPGQGAPTAPRGPAFSPPPPQPAQAGSLANAHADRNSGAVSQAYLQQMYQSLGTPPLAQATPPQLMGRPQQLNGPGVSPMGGQSPLNAQLNAATATQIGPRFGGPSQSSYLITPSARGDTTTLSENDHPPAPPLPPPATQTSAPNQPSRPPQTMPPRAFQSPYPPGGAHFRVEDGSNGGVATQVGRPQRTHSAWPMQSNGGTVSTQSSAMDVDEEVAGSTDAAVTTAQPEERLGGFAPAAGDSGPASFESQAQSPPEQRAGGMPLDDDVEDALAYLETQYTRVQDIFAPLPKEELEDAQRDLKSMVNNVLLDMCIAPDNEDEDETTPESSTGLPQTPPDDSTAYVDMTASEMAFVEQCSKDEMMMEYLFGRDEEGEAEFGRDEEGEAEQEIPKPPWPAYYEGVPAYLPPYWTNP